MEKCCDCDCVNTLYESMDGEVLDDGVHIYSSKALLLQELNTLRSHEAR